MCIRVNCTTNCNFSIVWLRRSRGKIILHFESHWMPLHGYFIHLHASCWYVFQFKVCEVRSCGSDVMWYLFLQALWFLFPSLTAWTSNLLEQWADVLNCVLYCLAHIGVIMLHVFCCCNFLWNLWNLQILLSVSAIVLDGWLLWLGETTWVLQNI